MSDSSRGSRFGVAVFASALALAGAAGTTAVASAEDTGAGSVSAGPQARAGQSAPGATPTRATRRAGGPAARTPRPAAAAEARRATPPAANDLPRSVPNASPPAHPISAEPVSGQPQPSPAAPPGLRPAALAAAVASPAQAAGTRAPSSRALGTGPQIEPLDLQQVASAVAPGIVSAVDGLTNWLSTLPTNPISDFLSGALLRLRDEISPPGLLGSGNVGPVKATVRNKTGLTLELWAYGDGSTSKPLYYITTLQPGQEWVSGIVSNTAAAAKGYDHNLIISTSYSVDGQPVIGEKPYDPHMRIVVTNPALGSPYVEALVAPLRGSSGTKNSKFSEALSQNESGTITQRNGVFPDGQGTFNYPAGAQLWVYRGNDISSGSFFTANTRDMVVEIWRLPQIEAPYDTAKDPKSNFLAS